MTKIISTALLLLATGACSGPSRPGADHVAPPEAEVDDLTESEAVADAGDAEAGAAADAGPGDDEFILTVREESYETFVDIHRREREEPAWHYRPRTKLLSLHWDRETPPEGQIEPLRAMLERLLDAYGEDVRGAKLRVDLDVFGYPAYVERLARHAADDPAWSRLVKLTRAAGERRVRDLHGYIVEVTRSGTLHPELDAVFLPFGMRPRLVDVEKCSSAGPASGGVLGDFLSGLGLRGGRQLPAGCLMAWFDLEPAVEQRPVQGSGNTDEGAGG